MPAVGWVATGGDASAYHYLLAGVRSFPGAPQFADEIRAQGFVDVGYERLSLGIVAIHTAHTAGGRRVRRRARGPCPTRLSKYAAKRPERLGAVRLRATPLYPS